jgi:lysocardiolipin and lysophospholipid acyltransferase
MFGITTIHFPFIILSFIYYPLWDLITAISSDTWFRILFVEIFRFHSYVFYLEVINGLKFVVTGEQISPKENVIVMANHPSESEWLFFWPFALRWHYGGSLKVMLKDTLRKVPGAGWVIDSNGFLFLGRDWSKDRSQIVYSCNRYLQSSFSTFLCIFPEGTDFSPAKLNKSMQFAKDNNIPFESKHVLLPRVKGFHAAANALRTKLDFVYDFTFAYPGRKTPTAWTAWAGFYPNEIHVHVRKFPASEIPIEEDELADWMYKRFKEKDDLLSYFAEHQKFPQSKEKPNWKLPISVYFWAIVWIAFVFFAIFFFFTNFYYRVYTLFGWGFYIISSFSPYVRTLRGLHPPKSS